MSDHCADSATMTTETSGHERQPAHETAAEKAVHGPVMKARTASAPASAVVPANQSSRRGPAAGA